MFIGQNYRKVVDLMEDENLLLPFKIKSSELSEETKISEEGITYLLKYRLGNRKFEYTKTFTSMDEYTDVRANAHKQLSVFIEEKKTKEINP